MRKFFWFALAILLLVLLFLAYRYLGVNKTVRQSAGEGTTGSDYVSSIIIPHFEGAKDSRQEYLRQIAQTSDFKKIVLVSTNHYSTGSADVVTCDQPFELKDSSTKPDLDIVKSLQNFAGAQNNKNAFLNEHGITAILPEINSIFKPANITPIIIKEGAPRAQVDKVFGAVKDSCNDCLLISSIDFSHYNPDSLAQIHDLMSLSALYSMDQEKALLAESDSPPVFYLTVKWAKAFGDQKFSLFKNSNSGKDESNATLESVSYIIGSYSGQAQKPEDVATTFAFAGDMMLDRYVYHQFKDDLVKIFDKLGPRVFWGSDISFLNNEGPISDKPINDDYTANNLIFNFPPETPKVLQSVHVNGVSLANNHSLNAGSTIFSNTRNVLSDAKIKSCGSQNEVDENSVVKYEGDIPVSIVCFNELENPSTDKISELVKTQKDTGRFVIVYPHWGNEYQSKHNDPQQKLAESLIDSGADMIIGSHPHVVQDFGIYKGKPIIYSLGNLVFDQSFSQKTQEGLIVAGVIKKDSVEISFLPTKQVNLQPVLESDLKIKQSRISEILDIENQTGFTKVSSDTIKINR